MNTAIRRLLLAVAPLFALTPLHAQVEPKADPVADPRNVVTDGTVRLTVLTPQLVRLEWAADGRFEDRPSLVFLDRHTPPVAFTQRNEDGWLVIATAQLTLRYRPKSGRFGPENLSITVKNADSTVTWRPGTTDTANLGGTTRTLDGAAGPVTIEKGLVSRDGWTLVDDSDRPLFDASPWPWVVQRAPAQRQDWYFFGYGHDYRRALADFTRVAGKIPMPPRFAFGAWWSRYWAYTDTELQQLVEDFHRHDVPLDVLVVDMDWHNTFELRWQGQPKDQAGQRLGWTGYTWDHAYFPDPDAFLGWVRQRGLHTTMNLHPASGIQPHEAQYPAMARATGIDPATGQYVPFRIEDQHFAEAYFANVIHPLERQGVDFWWLDWQQWGNTSIPGLTPTWWLNYVFFTDMERQGLHRPLIYHRWGGLGNHRYQIGFSGDMHSTWPALAFETYFTATAANVGFGYWSHDIGGHIPGPVAPELYTRWIQFGIFSPILRTHTTKNANAERRIWAYPAEFADAMRDAFQLRYAMIPYVYTAARRAYDSGVAVVHPLYYDWAEAADAYAFRDEYGFGADLVVSPVVAPMDSASALARERLWLPPGDWVEWSSGARLSGPRALDRAFALDELPVYVRAGAILPEQPKMERSGERPVDPLILDVFPGDSGSARIYEDAGDSLGYREGACTFTPVLERRTADTTALTIAPVEGSFRGMLQGRAYEVRLRGTWPPAHVTWQGADVPYRADGSAPGWRYDGDRLTTIVSLPRADVATRKELVVTPPAGADDALLDGVPGRLRRLEHGMTMLETLWPADWPSDAYVTLAQTGHRITLHPDSAAVELRRFREQLPDVLRALRQMKGDTAVIRRVLRHLDQAP
ncbi:MAG TPA: TIM-barrel domain-containing protein [Gemmatimonadales bacterium]|nr:TIM-barrel domain-containing protein [Gemmatimonadales bacterium]